MFAIEGVKLPSNASMQRSGTRTEFARQATKIEASAATMLARHRANDALAVEPGLAAKAVQRVERLERDAAQLRDWLATHPDERRGAKGAIRKSNHTDNESAKMATGKGLIQGYCGVAAVDSRHQIIVEAQAHGTGSEQALLLPVVTAPQEMLAPHTLLTADAGYHSQANLHALATLGVDALIADTAMRRRDARFATQERHQQAPDLLHDKSRVGGEASRVQPRDFTDDAAARTCLCPAGKSLVRKGQSRVTDGFVTEQFRGTKRDCGPCPLRKQCLGTPGSTTVRQGAFVRGRATQHGVRHSTPKKARIDSPRGRSDSPVERRMHWAHSDHLRLARSCPTWRPRVIAAKGPFSTASKFVAAADPP